MDRLYKVMLVIVACVVFGLMAYGAIFFILVILSLSAGSGCGIWQSGDGHSAIQHASDPSRRIPRWTDDGQRVMFDFPGVGRDPAIGGYRRDSIHIVDSDRVELKEWMPAEAPSSSNRFYVGDYAPDVMGDKVVFTTLRHACDGKKHYEIATANLDGSGYRRLTDADGSDILPTWSPDGSRIAFASNRIAFDESSGIGRYDKGAFNVYVMDADGSNVRSIAPDVFLRSNRYLPFHDDYKVTPPAPPVWSSNGWLAFRTSGDFLYTLHAEKPGVVSLGRTVAEPAFSPDGEWIAWSQIDRDAEPSDHYYYGKAIYVARPDGSEARRVFETDSDLSILAHIPGVRDLSWATDGQSLRFVSGPPRRVSGIAGLYQIGLDAPSTRLISEIPGKSMVVWSPDGSRALVANLIDHRYDEGEELLYTIAADGSDKRVLVRYTNIGLVAANGE